MKTLHVTVLTNAIVDILTHVENSFLATHGIEKGGYQILSGDEMETLYDQIPPATEQSGGSLANTAAGLSALGAKACCLAKVSDDMFGKIFQHDMKAAGVSFPMAPADSEEATGRSIILIDEEGDRSMNTDLGSSIEIAPQDLCEESIKNSEILCVEGYFWSHAITKQSLKHAVSVAKAAGTKIAFGLSAAWCVENFREEFLELISDSVDIILGNEGEYQALFQGTFSDVVSSLSEMNVLAVVTRGDQGSLIIKGEKVIHIPPFSTAQAMDATGAGDLYAAGFLYGITHGLDLETSGKLGSIVASEAISHVGARPDQTLLRKQVREAGFNIE